MQIRLSFSICFLLFSVYSTASTLDSIGTENLNGKKLIVHKVESKESYYSISRKYSVSPQSVIQYNNNKSLQIGLEIKVPTDRIYRTEKPGNLNSNSKVQDDSKVALVDYKVGTKETLYAISRKFNTTVDEIKALNKLTGNTLAAGQILKIRYGNISNQVTPASPIILNVPANMSNGRRNTPTQIDSSVNAGDRLKLPPARYGLREVDEHGVATWINDENIDGSKMLALHRTAPIGTVVKVTNPMTTKSTFAKVVGKFTENESTKDVIIVITKAAADMVGALDKRFQVNIVYGVPNE
ncbi:LysM peptidoglycan-binding domain-containing protein [Daejeonella oryzae]|uniref:LysM peptidoglycan-binding domain-containing protein n=1 Tax=Daejeonella oryzae TaxID=1122943 RepID=UPI0004252E45|nr:LysM peptidoglycan-binding domain-containing protein [Daejeonella oryzae]